MVRRTCKAILSHPHAKTGIKMGKFLLAGLPAFVLAIPLNIFFVEVVSIAKPIAYALVLVIQVTINFFMCRFLVFESSKTTSLRKQYFSFLSGIMLFRLGDWLVYSIATNLLTLHYTFVQIANITLFFIVKYMYSSKVFEGRNLNPAKRQQ